MGLMSSATRGVIWSGISQFSTQLYQLVVMVILARLLFPEDFGMIGMAVLFTGLIQTVNELGLSAAIIQKKNITDNQLSTSFWVSLGLGILLCVTTIAISPYISDFFNNEHVGLIVSFLSISFVPGSCGVVHRSLLEKNIEFKKLAVSEVSSSVTSGTISVILVLLKFGVWSLVFGSIISSFISVMLLWRICKWRPSIKVDLTSFKELFGFGSHVMGSRFLNYIDSNVDYLLIGKFLSATALGYYTLAYQMSTFPLTRISSIITRVTFPMFSIIQDDDDMLRYAYLKVIKYISLVTFPLLAGLIAVAPEFILVTFGEKWAPMIKPLQILCVLGALQSVGTTVGSVLLSKGRADIQFKWNIFAAFVLTISVLVGVRYGIMGVALSETLTTIVLFFIIQKITNDLIGLKFFDYFKAIQTGTFGSIIIIILILTFQKFNIFNYSSILSLIASVFFGVIGYSFVIIIFDANCFEEIKNYVSQLKASN